MPRLDAREDASARFRRPAAVLAYDIRRRKFEASCPPMHETNSETPPRPERPVVATLQKILTGNREHSSPIRARPAA